MTRAHWRWRCALCDAFGRAATEPEAFAEFERHYQTTHITKESK